MRGKDAAGRAAHDPPHPPPSPATPQTCNFKPRQLTSDPLCVTVTHLKDEPYSNDDITKATSMVGNDYERGGKAGTGAL